MPTLIHSVARLLLAIAEPHLNERNKTHEDGELEREGRSPEGLEHSVADDARLVNFDLKMVGGGRIRGAARTMHATTL